MIGGGTGDSGWETCSDAGSLASLTNYPETARDMMEAFTSCYMYERIDFLCSAIRILPPIEKRFLASFIESECQVHYASLKDVEYAVNNVGDSDWDSQDRASRLLIMICLCLLDNDNMHGADILYSKILGVEKIVDKSQFKPLDLMSAEIMTLLTMTVYHSAFTFHQKERVQRIIHRISVFRNSLKNYKVQRGCAADVFKPCANKSTGTDKVLQRHVGIQCKLIGSKHVISATNGSRRGSVDCQGINVSAPNIDDNQIITGLLNSGGELKQSLLFYNSHLFSSPQPRIVCNEDGGVSSECSRRSSASSLYNADDSTPHILYSKWPPQAAPVGGGAESVCSCCCDCHDLPLSSHRSSTPSYSLSANTDLPSDHLLPPLPGGGSSSCNTSRRSSVQQQQQGAAGVARCVAGGPAKVPLLYYHYTVHHVSALALTDPNFITLPPMFMAHELDNFIGDANKRSSPRGADRGGDVRNASVRYECVPGVMPYLHYQPQSAVCYQSPHLQLQYQPPTTANALLYPVTMLPVQTTHRGYQQHPDTECRQKEAAGVVAPFPSPTGTMCRLSPAQETPTHTETQQQQQQFQEMSPRFLYLDQQVPRDKQWPLVADTEYVDTLRASQPAACDQEGVRAQSVGGATSWSLGECRTLAGSQTEPAPAASCANCGHTGHSSRQCPQPSYQEYLQDTDASYKMKLDM